MIGFSIASSSDLPSEVQDSVPLLDMKSNSGESIHLGYSHPVGICLDCEHIVNSFIIKADQKSCRRALLQKSKRMKSMSQEMYNEVASEQIEDFLRESESQDLLLVYHRTTILAWGEGKQSEDIISQKLAVALSRMNVCASKVRKILPEEFLHSIPGNEMNFSKDDYLLGEACAAACLLPWESYEKGLLQGNLKVSERLSSRPINLDLAGEAYQKGWINAYNAFVLGPTGSGKSFFMNHYLRCCHDKGAKICVLDNGKSYEGLHALIKEEKRSTKKTVKKNVEKTLEFNPFTGFIKEGKWLISDDSLDMDNPSVQFFIGIVKTICDFSEEWNTAKSNILLEYIKAFCREYSRQEDPIFDDFYNYIADLKYNGEGKENDNEQLDQDFLKDIFVSLHAYCLTGDHSKTLNSRKEINLMEEDFSLFEIGELMDSPDNTYSRLCLFSIIHSFDIMMRQNVKTFKILVIEEAWKALSNKDMQPYLNSLWKTSRKYNTSAIVVTQQMSDIISSDIIKDTIIANSPVKIILDQRECSSELDDVAIVLGLTETDKRFIRSLNTQSRNDSAKDVFVKIGQGKSGAYKVEVSKEEAFLYESVIKDKSELSKTIKNSKSILALLKSQQ